MSVKIISKPFIIGATAAAAAIAAGLGGYVWKEEHRPPVLEIYIFALKSGRSVFIRTPEDKRILIDGGGNSDIVGEISKILPFYSRRIDTIISTDADGKNATGLISVVERYDVDRAFIPAVILSSIGLASSTDGIYSTFLDELRAKKITVNEVVAGDSIQLDSSVHADILFPVASSSFQYSKASAPQLLIRIVYKSAAASFMADATKKIQKFIALQSSSTADVLYVWQSADPNDLSEELMIALKPQFLVYSKTLKNSSADPSKATAKSTKTAVASNKKSTPKEQIDPLATIPVENRLNLKERGTIHLLSDGGAFSLSK